MTTRRSRMGLYRTNLQMIGECARVDEAAGDAAPYLPRALYEALHFSPRFDRLLMAEEFGPDPALQPDVGECVVTG
mgnify:CR=1 FL=1